MKPLPLRSFFTMPFAFALASFYSMALVPPMLPVATLTTVDSLDVGSNDVEATSMSVAIGDANALPFALRSLVIGESNSINDGDNLVSGGFNEVHAWANLVVGDANRLNSTVGIGESTAVFGYWNTCDNLINCLERVMHFNGEGLEHESNKG